MKPCDQRMKLPSVVSSGLDAWQRWYGNGVAWRLAPDSADALRDQLAIWNMVFATSDPTETLKSDKRHVITARGHLVMKRMQPRAGIWHRLRFAVRPSIARRACRLAVALRAAGLPVAEPLACGRQRRYGLTTAELTVATRISGVFPVTAVLRRASPERSVLLKAYGALLGRFHACGYANRDLKDENVLWSGSMADPLWVVDMDGVRRPRWLTRLRCARDWMALTRSLAICGCDDDQSLTLALQGYNAAVPPRLQWPRFPWFTETARRLGRR